MNQNEEVITVSTKINGAYITQLAREKCYYEGKFDWALKLLINCLQCDELTDREIKHIAMDILDGEAEIVGIYPNDDYGVEYLKEKDKLWSLSKLYSKNLEDINECKNIQEKYLFICEHLTKYELRSLNSEYKEEYGVRLFDDISFNNQPSSNSMLDSYLKRMNQDTEDDYGWLEPNGTFHAVEWGKHQLWAEDYVDNYLEEEYDEFMSHGLPFISAGDYLAQKGWILLHNPAQGIAHPTMSDNKNMTKAQKEFLYQYYIDRDCNNEANKIWNE